jgi:hypothetical protein
MTSPFSPASPVSVVHRDGKFYSSLLSCWRLPARIDVNQTAEVLGFLPYEIPVLISSNLLKPLGRPAPNGHKYFCADEILELSHDRSWLDKATRVLIRHRQDKKLREKERKVVA